MVSGRRIVMMNAECFCEEIDYANADEPPVLQIKKKQGNAGNIDILVEDGDKGIVHHYETEDKKDDP